MKLILIESPFAGAIQLNKSYARAAMLDSLRRGEAPFASHLLYTQVLNDSTPAEREQGIAAGLLWGQRAALTVVYYDLGVSRGMAHGITEAGIHGRPVEWRSLGGRWAQIGKEAPGTPWILRPPS